MNAMPCGGTAMLTAAAFVLAAQTSKTFQPPIDPCNHDAQLLASTPARLPAARYKTIQGVPEALVSVTIDAHGTVLSAMIVRSAGAIDLDRAALESARLSTYAPAEQNCKPAGQTFGITIDFQANDYDCNHNASIVGPAAAPAPDFQTQRSGGAVTAIVRVTIAANGSVSGTTLAQSTGNANLDAAALNAARQSTYSPKVVNCRPVAGDYLFKVTFDPN